MTSEATREGFLRAGKELLQKNDGSAGAGDSVQLLHYQSNRRNGFLVVVDPSKIGRIRK